jgi:anti-sigma factor RsiW
MLLVDKDMDLLEDYLDGALDAAAAAALVERLSLDATLAVALQSLRAERKVRQGVWAALEPSEGDVSRLIARVNAASKRRKLWFTRPMRIGAAAAACVAISFLAGWKLHGNKQLAASQTSPAIVNSAGPKVETIVSYQVALTDENGHVTAVQNFESLEKAREFANDLGRWQERQHQMRDGAAVVVADKF